MCYDYELVVGMCIDCGFYVIDYFVDWYDFFVRMVVVMFLVDLVFEVYGCDVGVDE